MRTAIRSCEELVFFLLILCAGAGYCLPPVNADEGAIFDFATRMLDGKGLYTDLIDVNPPMIFLLNLLPASIARHSALPIPAIITVCVLLLPLVAWRSLLRFAHLPSEQVWVTRAMALALLYLLLLYPGAEFSQREHLILLSTIPYLVNLHRFLAPQDEQRHLVRRLIEIIPFALLVCLKPYFVLVPLLLETVALAHVRRSGRPWLRLEAGIMIGIFVGYGLATLIFFPAYLARVLPLAQHYYGIADADQVSGAFLGSEAWPLLLALAMLVVIYALFLRRLWLLLLLVTIFGFYLAAALQLKDWSYHFLPARTLTLLALIACAATLVAERRAAGTHSVAQSAFALALVPLIFCVVLRDISDPDSALPLPYPAQRAFHADGWNHVRDIVAARAAGRTTMWLSQYNDGTARALAYAHAELIAPTMSLWMLPALYKTHQVRDGKIVFHRPSAMSPDETWLWNAVSDAFDRVAPPVLVDVIDDPGLAPGRFDYVEYFSTNPRFRARFATYRKIYEDSSARIYVKGPGTALVAGAR